MKKTLSVLLSVLLLSLVTVPSFAAPATLNKENPVGSVKISTGEGKQDEYELTEQSRNHAEREFRKKGDQIVWDASRKAEDVYAASVIYTDEALSRVRDIINDTNESLEKQCKNMMDKIAEKEKIVKTNQ